MGMIEANGARFGYDEAGEGPAVVLPTLDEDAIVAGWRKRKARSAER